MTDKIEWHPNGTPGPWEFHKHHANSPYFGNIIGNYGLNEYGIKSIRTISCQLRYGDEQERYANARAIAEVPAMVVALREAESLIAEAQEALYGRDDVCVDADGNDALHIWREKNCAILARIDKGE